MSGTRQWKSKEEYKKEKELEEARKAGTAAPEVDEEGKEINPHIPQYIAQAPWYLSSNHPGLKHQRILGEKGDYAKPQDWYERGKFKGPAANKFRKGSCTNCGAMTHNAKTCTERPRKLGAKYTHTDIKPDEVIVELAFDFEGKRDRWNGYDPRMHEMVVKEHEAVDAARRDLKAKQMESSLLNEGDTAKAEATGVVAASDGEKSGREEKRAARRKPKAEVAPGAELVEGEAQGGEKEADGQEQANGEENKEGADSDSDDEEGGLDEDLEAGNEALIQKHDPRTRTTVRNLRIREDTAKYLRNLAIKSAYYDPKTRSMRENPHSGSDPNEVIYQGDNFVRHSGDYSRFAGLQLYTHEASEKGQQVHMLAMPSQAELMYRQFKVRKEDLKSKQADKIIEKYGPQDNHSPPPRELLLAQTEQYVEYAPDGRVIKGAEKAIPKSKYEEDVKTNNHTTVWGSWWYKGQWGYACCHQMTRNSYCTGEAGKAAAEQAADHIVAQLGRKAAETSHEEEKKKKEKSEEEKREELRRKAEDEKKFNEPDDRKRPYNSMRAEYDVTEEEMEQYRSKRLHFDDPMRAFLEGKS